jgi:hypothetical protein
MELVSDDEGSLEMDDDEGRLEMDGGVDEGVGGLVSDVASGGVGVVGVVSGVALEGSGKVPGAAPWGVVSCFGGRVMARGTATSSV